jgi:hypothetical protein
MPPPPGRWRWRYPPPSRSGRISPPSASGWRPGRAPPGPARCSVGGEGGGGRALLADCGRGPSRRGRDRCLADAQRAVRLARPRLDRIRTNGGGQARSGRGHRRAGRVQPLAQRAGGRDQPAAVAPRGRRRAGPGRRRGGGGGRARHTGPAQVGIRRADRARSGGRRLRHHRARTAHRRVRSARSQPIPRPRGGLRLGIRCRPGA